MSDIRELYQEVIIDHGTQPRHFGTLPTPTCTQCGHNPLCGDSIILQLTLNKAHDHIEKIAFRGEGCAIAMASTSLMAEALQNQPVAHAEALIKAMHKMLTEEDQSEAILSTVKKLAVLSGVSAYPARVKCATLAWHTLAAALSDDQDTVSTE